MAVSRKKEEHNKEGMGGEGGGEGEALVCVCVRVSVVSPSLAAARHGHVRAAANVSILRLLSFANNSRKAHAGNCVYIFFYL